MGAKGTPIAKRAEVSERRTKAIAMKLAGADWQAIADALGYSDRGAACKDVSRALEQYRREEAAAVEELRQVTIARYDRLQAAFWQRAVNDKDPKAADVVLKCLAGRAKIEGIATEKVELSGGVRYEIVGLDDKGADG